VLLGQESDRIVAWHNPCGHQERGMPGQEEISLEDAGRLLAASGRYATDRAGQSTGVPTGVRTADDEDAAEATG